MVKFHHYVGERNALTITAPHQMKQLDVDIRKKNITISVDLKSSCSIA